MKTGMVLGGAALLALCFVTLAPRALAQDSVASDAPVVAAPPPTTLLAPDETKEAQVPTEAVPVLPQTREPAKSSPQAQVAPAKAVPSPAQNFGSQFNSEDKGLFLVFGAVAVLLVLAWLTFMAASFSNSRYGYPIFLNWNVPLWLIGTVANGVLIYSMSQLSRQGLMVGFGAACLPWLIAVFRNIKNTNLVFGILISVPQFLFSIVAIWLFGQIVGRDRPARSGS